MTYAAHHRLCKAGEKHAIRKEWAYIRFSRIDPKALPWIGGVFMDMESALLNTALHRGSRFNKETGVYNFRDISYAGLPAIEKELSQLIKENVPFAMQLSK
jgi:hypothetical protein